MTRVFNLCPGRRHGLKIAATKGSAAYRPPFGRARAGSVAAFTAAFTLVEMLVVIGIIVVLIGIAVPVLSRAYKNAVRTRMAADLQVISTGLEAYKGDFKDYPRVDPGGSGAVLLCWALLARGPESQDGADGPGFRLRSSQGQIYGPYIAPGRFNIGGTNDSDSTINDRYGHPYLYFPGNRSASPTTAYVQQWSSGQTPIPMYNANDNLVYFRHTPESNDSISIQRLQGAMGDTNFNGIIDGSENAATTGNYVLWGAGPDEQYGPGYIFGTTKFDWNHFDDVTNFGQ